MSDRNLNDAKQGSPEPATPRRLSVLLPDGTGFSFDRRDFLRVAAAATAAAGLAGTSGCAPEPEVIRPSVTRPEEARPGLALHYSTACFGCPAGCGVVAKTREGRIIKLEGNAEHPINRGALCARGQAAVLDVYDPDRARTSLLVSRGKSPATKLSRDLADARVIEALKKVQGTAKVRLLTGALSGTGMRALVADFLALFPGSKHVVWEPLASTVDSVAEAQRLCHGRSLIPQYRLERADVVVALGSEFLDTWLSPMQLAQSFAARRDPASPKGMSKLWVFEGRMSLTGSNADERFRVRPSALPELALALANHIIVVKQHGPLAEDQAIARQLAPYSTHAVAKRCGLSQQDLEKVADALIASSGKSLVVAGGAASTGGAGLALEVAVNLLNSALGNDGITVDYAHPSNQHAGSDMELASLAHELRTGQVDVLIVWGANPVFAAPQVLGFAEAMSHVPMIVAGAERLDETAELADVLIAAAHPLESWMDIAPVYGMATIAQPAMEPIGEMRSLGDALVGWGALVDKESGLAAARMKAVEKNAVPSAAYHYLREHWRQNYYSATSETDFEIFWRDLLHVGLVVPKQEPMPDGPPRGFEASVSIAAPESHHDGMELVLFASHSMYDGRGANNGWLLEYPDPITRSTWNSWVGLSRKRMLQMGLTTGDLCDVEAAGVRVQLPAVMVPGQHDDVASVPLGWGRRAAGAVGNGLGVNGFLLAAAGPRGPQLSGHPVSVTKASGSVALAIPQGEKVIDLSERPLIPLTTLSEYKKNPSAGTERPAGAHSIWPEHKYPDVRWGMALDLNKCIGCGACTIACQAENNIATAGSQGVLHGREMHWIRVDRYYAMPVKRAAKTRDDVALQRKQREEAIDGDWLDNPVVVHHPLMCQHCENAPCETVCPVAATNHSEDGLNVQAYNRCVGTRYCSNNCPFKARRFNWFDYSKDRSGWLARILQPDLPNIARMNVRWPLQLKYNPEVTVRSRGVMEKCTFCVQRIAVGRGRSKDENRKLRDGDVIPACMQTCPTQAIVFGNLSDPESAVAKLRASPRGLHMLDEQKLGTSVTYLSKVRNDLDGGEQHEG